MSVLSNRRGLLLGGAALLAVAPRRVFAQAAAPPAPTGPFTLPPLPYAMEANEAASSDAPPTRAPETPGAARSEPALSAVTEPP